MQMIKHLNSTNGGMRMHGGNSQPPAYHDGQSSHQLPQSLRGANIAGLGVQQHSTNEKKDNAANQFSQAKLARNNPNRLIL